MNRTRRQYCGRRRPRHHPRQDSPAERLAAAQQLLDAVGQSMAAATANAQRADLKALAEFLGILPPEPAAALELLLRYPIHPGDANLHVDRWVGSMRGRLSPATVNRRLATLRTLTRHACDYNQISWTLHVKSLPVQALRDTRGPGPATVLRMFNAATATPGKKGARDLAILRLLADLALRSAEVRAMDLADVDIRRHTIQVLAKGKVEKALMALPPRTEEALAEWIILRGQHNGPVFSPLSHPQRPDARLTAPGLYGLIVRLGRAADAEIRVTPHGLRHTAITAVYTETHQPQMAQRFARHAKIETTMRYIDTVEDVAGEAALVVSDLYHRFGT